MKSAIFLSFLVSAILGEEWFVQKLDHLDPTSTTTWRQRYFDNWDYFNQTQGGPIFLMIGSESAALQHRIMRSAMVDYARQLGALCFYLEHRFYGESHPTENTTVENLQYLSSEQALGDVAKFIVGMNAKHNLSPNSSWIAFGGSYAGNLASWARLKYPGLVRGAVASSAPLVATLDFKDAFQHAMDTFKNQSEKCFSSLEKAFLEFDDWIWAWPDQINELFDLCWPVQGSLQNRKDLSSLHYYLANQVIQRVTGASKNTVRKFCETMVHPITGNPVQRLAELYRNAVTKCTLYNYDRIIAYYTDVAWISTATSTTRPWLYQTCTEFGFFETSSSFPHLFGDYFDLDYFVQRCQDIFGPRYDFGYIAAGVERTNKNYGGLNPNVTNVVYVHGSLDPWSSLGFTQSPNTDISVFVIRGMAHCGDMFAQSVNDLDELREVKSQIVKLIQKWIR